MNDSLIVYIEKDIVNVIDNEYYSISKFCIFLL